MQHGLPKSLEIILELIDADGAYFNSQLDQLLGRLLHLHSDVIMQDYLARVKANDVDTIKPPSAAIQQVINSLSVPLTPDEEKKIESQVTQNIKKILVANSRFEKLQAAMASTNMLVKSNLLEFNRHNDFACLRAHEDDHDLTASPYVDFQSKLHPALRQAVMLQANAKLVAHMRTHVKPNSIVYYGTGSNRQCQHFDFQGEMLNGTTSFFEELLSLTNYLRREKSVPTADIRLFPATTTDGRHNLPHGTTFRYKLSGVTLKPYASLFDETKISLIYFMVHTMSKRHPDSPLTVYLYDDRKDDILKNSQQFYAKHADLLPSNTTLVLQHYIGGELHDAVTIKGTGERDDNVNANYQTLLKLCQTARLRKSDKLAFDSLPPDKQKAHLDDCYMIDAAIDLEVDAFRKCRTLTATTPANTLPVILDADNCFYSRPYFYFLCSVVAKYKKELLSLQVTEDAILAYLRELTTPTDKHSMNKFIIETLAGTEIAIDDDIIEIINSADRKKDFYSEELSQLHRLLDSISPNITLQILLRANEPLITHIIQQAKQHQCTNVVFYIGTNRQSVEMDKLYAVLHGTGRFHLDITRFADALNTHCAEAGLQFSCKRVLLTDFQHQLTPGTAHTGNTKDNQFSHLTCFTDVSKIVLLYALMHHIKHHMSDCRRVLFYDDQSQLFTDMLNLLGHNDEVYRMFPKHLQLHFFPYNGEVVPLTSNNTFTGVGDVNPHLHHVISQFAQLLATHYKTASDSIIHIANDNGLKVFANLPSLLPAKVTAFETLTNLPSVVRSPSSPFFRRAVTQHQANDKPAVSSPTPMN